VREPRLRILYVTHGQGFAEENIAAARNIAIAAGVSMGDSQRVDKWTTKAGGCVVASGLNGGLMGKGFHVIICDDPHRNAGEAHSRTIREGVIRGFKTDVWTRKLPANPWWPGTSVYVFHTRWIDVDLIGTLTTQKNPWPLINLPVFDEAGNVLAPKLWPAEAMEAERAELGEYDFAALYLGSPRPLAGALFGEVTTFSDLGVGGAYRWCIGIDLARTARSRSDYNAAVAMRLNVETKVVDVVEVLREQGTLTDRVTGRGDEPELHEGFLRSLHDMTKRYPAAPVVMYGAKDESLIIALAGRHDKYPVRIRHFLADKEKYRRAQPYATAWNSPEGRLRVLVGPRWFDAFVREHVNFTGTEGGPKDDQVDAAVAGYDFLMKSGGARGKARGSGDGNVLDRMGGVIAA
jgi:hypothetical protein